MVLNRKCRFILEFNSFNGIIIQVNMCYLGIGRISDSIRIHTESMILGCDLTKTGYYVTNRVIQAPVSVMHFKGRYVVGQCQQLLAQADAK